MFRALNIKINGVRSAGRALTYHTHPLVIQEMEEYFYLNHALQCGH